MAVPDVIEALRTILLADTDTAALVTDRVFGQEIGKTDVRKAMPQAAIVLNGAGGPGSPGHTGDYGIERVDALCYGATLNQSRKVYLAVYAALKQVQRRKVNGALIHWVIASSKGATGIDPLEQWPVTLASFNVLAAEVAAA